MTDVAATMVVSLDGRPTDASVEWYAEGAILRALSVKVPIETGLFGGRHEVAVRIEFAPGLVVTPEQTR
jgi:hypothetical protein